MSSTLVSKSARVSGSFRDPSGYVFHREGRLLRAVDADCYQSIKELRQHGLLDELMQRGLLVRTELVSDAELIRELVEENPGFYRFLEHRPLWPISHPYEWTVSMLADAALLTFDLQLRLLQDEYALKDATAYNVQFDAAKPIFIDVPSIERPMRLDLWTALGQFQQMFTFPLILAVHRGWDPRGYFLANLNGLSLQRVVQALGCTHYCRPHFWLDVTLPYLLGKRKSAQAGHSNEIIQRPNKNAPAQIFNLNRLRRKISRLAKRYRPDGVWVDYTTTCTYDEAADREKQRLVGQFLAQRQPDTVLDLGCNTGIYSRLAADTGARVLAIDGDHGAVEILYRRLRESPAPITPLVVDLANPSPAIGFRNDERESFLRRAQSDCVLALALVHHLMVTNHLSAAAITDLFADLTRDCLVVEYVPQEDAMFQQLLRHRVGSFPPVSLEFFVEMLGSRFELLRQEPISHTERTLLFLRKRR